MTNDQRPMTNNKAHSPKHQKNASKAATSVKEVRGFKEFNMSRGKNTRVSENSQLLNNASKIKIMKGIVPPKKETIPNPVLRVGEK